MFGAMEPKALFASGCSALAIATALGLAPVAAQVAQSAVTQQAPPAAIVLKAAVGEPTPDMSISLIGILGADGAQASPAEAPRALIPLPRAVAGTTPDDPATPDSITLAGPRIVNAAATTPTATDAPTTPAIEPARPLAGIWPLDIGLVSKGRAQFRGERDSLEFALFVPPGAPASELTVSAVSSAFILPGRSVLRVFSGDRLIGETPLRSITGLERMTFALAPGLLDPGVNRIRIEVDLAHRLYCGALPAYDLWTSVDLAASGVPFEPDAMGANDDAFFAAANVARTAGKPLLIRSDSAELATSLEAREISRRLGQALGGGLTFASSPRPLRAGDYPAPVIDFKDGAAGVRFRLGADGEQVLEIGVENGVVPDLFGAGATIAAANAPPDLPLDVPVPLSHLGFSTVRISEHLWTQSLPFRLPPDWLMNVRDRAVLNLGYAYLPGMPTGAELRVLMNGAVVRIIPLDRGGRLEDAPLEVRFDAGLLNAGRNVLGFEAVVPGDPADQPCLTADVSRIEIRDGSTLIVPSTPSMHMPGITRWMSGGGPLRIEASANAAAGPDAAARSEMYLDLAAALHGVGVTDREAPARRLVVLRPTDLSSAVFGEFGMGRQGMLATLQRPVAATAAPEPAALPGAAQARTLDQGPLTYTVQPTGYVDTAIDAVRGLGGDMWQALGRLAFPDPVADLGDWLSRQRGQAILFQLDRAAPNDLNLLVSGDARTEDVLTAIGQAAESGVPLDGHVALLTWDGNWVTWSDDTRLPVLEENLDQANWRGVIGNYASARPRFFVGLLAGIALLSVLIANSYISASRRQR